MAGWPALQTARHSQRNKAPMYLSFMSRPTITTVAITTVAISALLCSSAVSALTLPAEALQGQVQLCISTAQIPGSSRAALTPAQLKSYCDCDTRTYWASVPQAEMDAKSREMMAGTLNGPANQRLSSQMKARQNASRLLCNKQLGLNVPPEQ